MNEVDKNAYDSLSHYKAKIDKQNWMNEVLKPRVLSILITYVNN